MSSVYRGQIQRGSQEGPFSSFRPHYHPKGVISLSTPTHRAVAYEAVPLLSISSMGFSSMESMQRNTINSFPSAGAGDRGKELPDASTGWLYADSVMWHSMWLVSCSLNQYQHGQHLSTSVSSIWRMGREPLKRRSRKKAPFDWHMKS